MSPHDSEIPCAVPALPYVRPLQAAYFKLRPREPMNSVTRARDTFKSVTRARDTFACQKCRSKVSRARVTLLRDESVSRARDTFESVTRAGA